MGTHNIQAELERGKNFKTAFRGMESPEGFTLGFGTTVGNGVQGWAPGAIFIDTDASSNNVKMNNGSVTAASWIDISDAGVADGFSVTSGAVTLDGANVVIKDNDLLAFGDKTGADADVSMKWDGTNLEILPDVDDTGAFNVGDGTTDMDFKVFLGATTAYLEAEVGAGQVNIEGAELHMGDSDEIEFGDSNDVIVQWDGTRLTSNAAANAMWDDCPCVLDPNHTAGSFRIVDDFYTLDTTATVGNWAAFNVGTGTTTIADDVAGGVCVLTCQATTDDACEQLNYVSAPFLLAAGKTLWYETRLKIVGDAQSEHSFGLCALSEDLTAVADVLPADGCSFSTQDASLAAALTCSKDGTDTGAVAGVHTLVSDTYVTLGFKIDGLTSCTPYVNGVAGTAATATFSDDESLCPYFLVRNGDGTTQQVMHVDYVKVVQLR